MPKKTAKKSTKKSKTATSKSQPEVKSKEVIRAPINHFEIPFDDQKRVKSFYGDVFGWGFQDMPEIDYTMVFTDKLNENGTPSTPGVVNGGFTKRNPIQQQPTLVITVENINETIEKIKAYGCEIQGELLDVGMGLYHLFKDPEGNVLGVFQSKQM